MVTVSLVVLLSLNKKVVYNYVNMASARYMLKDDNEY